MIHVKKPHEITAMRRAGLIVADVLTMLADHIKPGVNTFDLDAMAEEFILARGGFPSCKGYCGYPATLCASIDDVVVHGIPSKDTILEEGMIVSLDICARADGYNADATRTFAVGKIDREKERLIRVTEESFWEAKARIKNGVYVSDIAKTIQDYCEARGFSLVRALTGHGIGKKLHEDPNIPNFWTGGVGVRLTTGMAIAVEPMVCAGSYEVDFSSEDGWTVRTRDGKPAAHYENTLLITDDGCEVITLREGAANAE